MCSATSDIVLKKMCYLYVGNYAKVNPDLALLTINFLQRDCKDMDSMIQGLALRSLCSLRVPNLVEYLVGPLGSGLTDNKSYERTVATIGVLKLYHISATLKYLMLNDSDTQIWSVEARTSEEASREREALISKPVMYYYFLNWIKEFSEWGKCLVLELVGKYVPSDGNEIFDIMNLLEDRLHHANSAVVLATIKVFLQLTLSMTDVHQQVRLHLLTAVMECFFKRPPETQKALGAALASGLTDFHQDVHDRALFYHRLLQYSVSVAEQVVNPPKQAVSVFADAQSSEIKDRIFDEFNSLSVVYQKPSYMFTDKEHRGPFEFSDELGSLPVGTESANDMVPVPRVEANDKDLLLSTSEKLKENGGDSAYNAPSYDGSSIVTAALQMQSLAISNPAVPGHAHPASLAIDDLLGLGAPSPAPSPPALKLNPKATLDPGTFQQKWRQQPIAASQEYSLSLQGAAALTTPQALLRHMQGDSIHCIASGGQSPNFKFFFFAQKAEEASSFLVEYKINISSGKVQMNIKADDQSTSLAFSALFQSSSSSFGMQGSTRIASA